MSAALTFGSVGDIIALCGLAVELSRVLGSTRGSAKEYQFMCKDLDQFVQVLMQVVATYQQFQASPWLDGLANVTRSIVDESGKLLREVLDGVRDKYKGSLQPVGSGSIIKDTFRKIEFSVRERERLRELRMNLSEAVGRLGLMTSCAAIRSQRVDNATLISRIEEMKKLVATHDDLKALAEAITRLELQHKTESREREAQSLYQKGFLTRLGDQLTSHSSDTQQQLHQIEDRMTQGSSSTSTQLARIEDHLVQHSSRTQPIISSLTGVFSVVSDIKNMLLGIGEAVAQLHTTASNRWFLQGPSEGTIVFEDPFGRVDPFPLNWIHSWEGLQTIMELRFRDSTGYDMVVQKEYVLEDDCNGSIIDQKKPFKDAFRVQKKVNMNMLFRRQSAAVRTLPCPRCELPARVPDGNRVKCARDTCGMWFGLLDLATPRARADQRASTNPAVAHPRASDFQRVRFILIQIEHTQPKIRLVVVRKLFWTCHNCFNSPMTLDLYDSCFRCNHHRCKDCVKWSQMTYDR